MPPRPDKSVCPQCAGAGELWIHDARGIRVAVPCGASVCRGVLEERIVDRMTRQMQAWLAAREAAPIAATLLADHQFVNRIIAEVMRHLPPDIRQRRTR